MYEGESQAWFGVMDLKLRQGHPAEGAFEAALAACDKALQADPESADAHALKSIALWRRADHEWTGGADPRPLLHRSLESAREAVRWGPSKPEGHRSKGIAASILAQYELSHGGDPGASIAEAIASFEKALEINPALDEVCSKLGNAYDTRGQHERKRGQDPGDSFSRAVRMHLKATEINPGFAGHHNNLGLAYKGEAEYERDRGGDPRPGLERATQSFQKAIARNPKHALAFANLGIVQIVRAGYEVDHGLDPGPSLTEARSAWQSASSLNPSLAAWASVFRGQSELLAARWALREGRSPEPHFAEAQALLARSSEVQEAEAYEAAADLCRWQADWRLQRRRPAQDAIRRGLAAVDRALSLDPKASRAVALRGALQLLQARGSRDARDRDRLARLAATSLERSIEMDELLEREFGSVLAEAQGLIGAAHAATPH